jgi:uncharacterized protein
MSDVALREIRYGRVWRANACRIVDERDDRVLLWSPRGIIRYLPVDNVGIEIRLPRPDWSLGTRTTVAESLVVMRPDTHHSISLFWDEEGRFSHWYVNFEQPLGRTRFGWDYVDDKLDLVVAADGSWRLKDEDELDEAHRLGLLDAAQVRAEAECVLATWPFPTGWEDWRPDPGWPLPELPDGWERL